VLPLPPIRWNKTSTSRTLKSSLDRYTLWAFNPQPVLADPARLRSEDQAAG
jgi:hypothetical protein